MNKKVLTLCAGFLLAGSSFTSVNADNLVDAAKVDGGYFLVYVNNGADISTSYAGSSLLSADAEKGFLADASEENKEDLAYLWKVETVTSNGKVIGYKLVNAKSGAALSVKDGDDVYDTFSGDATALWFDATSNKGFFGEADDVDASSDLAPTASNAVWRYHLVEVKDEVVSDEDLNELYNSTGFNLKLNDDKYKDVANIFDDQRIKAIKIGRGDDLTDPVESPVASEKGYGFPAGTYFVVSTPAGAYPENASGNVGAQYEYLQQCTFIAVNPVENDINGKAEREAGKGFQLTTVLGSDMNKYIGTDKQKQPKGRQISVSNACFEVSKDVNDDYAIVEECAKDYLSDLFKQILEISNIINDDKISDVLTISNFNDDGPDFKNTKDYLKTTKQKILNLEADILFYLEEKTIMAYIIDENLEDSYINLYKSLKFAKNKEVLEKKEYIENLVDQFVNKIEQEEKVIEFLIENKNNWNISDNTINFNSSQLSDEYNKMIAEINK